MAESHNNNEDDAQSIAVSETSSEHSRPPLRSLKSWRSLSSIGRARARSGPRHPDEQFHRIASRGFPDDQANYFHDHELEHRRAIEAGDVDGAETESNLDASNEKTNEENREEEEREEIVEEEEERHSKDSTDGDHPETKDVDLEKGPPPLGRQETTKSTRSTRSQKQRDPNLVSWSGPDDPENPRNWKHSRQWAAVLVVSAFAFISPVSSTIVAPALPAMDATLHVENGVISQMLLSIFVLAYAFGPLILGPLSEMYGRVPVLQGANLFFMIFNMVCGFAKTDGQLLAFRFLAGLGGSAPLAIGGGIIADCFPPERRGEAIAVYALAPLIGPAIGPIAGGFIAQTISWRWLFWAVSIADAVIQIFGIFLLQETWAPKLLEQKAERLRKETGNMDLYAGLKTPQNKLKKLEVSLIRPFRLLLTQPIAICLAIYMAYLYGLVYLVVSSFSALYTSPAYYNEKPGTSGLHYIAAAIGYTIGAQISARVNDMLYKRLKKRNNGQGKPEFRVPTMVPGALLLPVGLLWYGWSAEARLFWLMPDIGVAILLAATIAATLGINTYVIDCYTTYAASAMAAITSLRSLAGFGFPLFAPAMYQALGYGWGNSLLALVAIAIGWPAPAFFWFYGQKLRERSPFAAG